MFLGATLVGTGALSESELSRSLTLKTEEIIYGLFLWDDAMFEFTDAEFAPLPFRLALSVQDVLLKGVRRYDEIQRIREVFPHSNVVLRPLGGIPRQVREKPAARRVYEAIDGRRSISAIALHVHGSEFIVSKFLFDLHRAGRVEIVSVGRPPRKAPPPPSDAPVDATGGLTRVERLLEDGAYRGALDALAALPGDDPRARRLTEQAEGLLMDKTYRLHLPPDGVPVLARPMSEMIDQNLSAEESYLLSRIDGEWDVRSIISISPLREIDALLTLDRLREKGLIKLN